MSHPVALAAAASGFAQEVQDLLRAVLPISAQVIAEELGPRYVVRPAEASKHGGRLTLHVEGVAVGALGVRFRCYLDHQGRYLAIEESQFVLSWGQVGDPLVRLHFRREPRTTPAAHWHLHAERGALSALLAQAGRPNPHSLAGLHFPSGGGRMRPSLEDFLEFLIRECGVDARPGYGDALADSREIWRRRQIAALVRDAPQEAIRVLEANGYVVTAPSTGALAGQPVKLRQW